MYDFYAVLDECIPIGAKLYWAANAYTPSEDDDIAEFFETDG